MTPPLPTDAIWATRAEVAGIDLLDVLLLAAVVYTALTWLNRCRRAGWKVVSLWD